MSKHLLLIVLLCAVSSDAGAANLAQVRSSGYWGPVEYCHHSLTQDGDKATPWGTNASPGDVWIEFEFDSPASVGSLILYAAPMRLGPNLPANDITSISVQADGVTVLTQSLTWAGGLAPSLAVNLPAGTTASVLRIQVLACAYPGRMMGFSEIMILPPGATEEGQRYPYDDAVTLGVKSRQAFYTSEKQQTASILAQLHNDYPLSSDPRFSSQVTQNSSNIIFTREMTEMTCSKTSGCITSVRMLDSVYTGANCMLGNLTILLPTGSLAQQKNFVVTSMSVVDSARTVTMTANISMWGMPFEEKYTYYKSSGVLFLNYRYTGTSDLQVRRLTVYNRLTDSSLVNLFKQADGQPSFLTAVDSPFAHWVARDHGFQVGATDWRDTKGSYSGWASALIDAGQTGNEKRLDVCFISQLDGTPATLQPGDEFGLYICLFPTKKHDYQPVVHVSDIATEYEYVNWNWTSELERYITEQGNWFSGATFQHCSWMPRWSPMDRPTDVKKLTDFAETKGLNISLYNDVRWGSTSDTTHAGIVTYDDVKDASPGDFGLSLGSPGWRLALLNAYRMALDANQGPDMFYLDSISCTPDLAELGVSNAEGIQLFLEDLRVLANNYPAAKKRTLLAQDWHRHVGPTAALVDYFYPGEQIGGSNVEELSQEYQDTSYNPYMDGCGVIVYDANSYKLDSGKFYLCIMRYPVSVAFPHFPFVYQSRAAFNDINLTYAERRMFDRLIRPVLEATVGRSVEVVHPVDKDYSDHLRVVSGNPWVTVYEIDGKSVLVVTTQPGQYQTSGVLQYKLPVQVGLVRVSNASGNQQVTNGWVNISYNVVNEPQIITVNHTPGWNLTEEFSHISNPNSPWSYGYVAAGEPLDSFQPYATSYSIGSPTQCAGWGSASLGAITKNVSGDDAWLSFNYWVPEDGLYAFPGPGPSTSVRWTSPINGRVLVEAAFNGCANKAGSGGVALPSTCDVHVLVDGVSVWDGYVSGAAGGGDVNGVGSAPVQNYSGYAYVGAGSTIDFVIGYGNGSNIADRLNLSAAIDAEPVLVPQVAHVWDAAAEFSWTNNPNPPWSYATKEDKNPTGPITMTLNPVQEPGYQLFGWADTSMTKILKNITESGIDVWYGVRVPAGGFDIKPGWGPNACIRWTSPIDGLVMTDAIFRGLYSTWTYGDVYVVNNSSVMFSGIVQGFIGWDENSPQGPSPIQSFSGMTTVAQGDTIDFVFGYGPQELNPQNTEDYTDLDATITSYALTSVEKVSDLRSLPDGEWVWLAAPVVVTAGTGTFDDGGCYVEAPDRASGIKVLPCPFTPVLTVGESVTFTGVIDTDANGERVVTLSALTSQAGGNPVGELGMTNRSVWADLPDSAGLLVKIWGRVTYRAGDGSYFYVDDGSGITDATGACGIRVALSDLIAGASAPAEDEYVTISGLVGLVRVGAVTIKVVRPRSQADIGAG